MMVRLTLTCVLAFGTHAFAQSLPDVPKSPVTLGFSYDESLIRDLPTSDSLYSVLETIQPSLITDRFTGGGLFTGQPARVGGFLSSWSQTQFRIGDVDVTDPTGSGTPLLFPDLGPWQRVHVATGLLPEDVGAAGLAITFEPRVRSGIWQHQLDGMTSHGRMATIAPVAPVTSIARLTGRDRLAWSSAGTLVPDRLNLALSASWTKGAQAARAETTDVEAHVFSTLATLAYTAESGREWTTIGWLVRAEVPFEYRLPWRSPAATSAETGVHVQTTWASNGRADRPWRVFGSYSQRSRTPFVTSSTALVERLLDGPVSAIADPSRGLVRVGSLGARVSRTRTSGARAHQLRAGIDVTASRQRTPPSGIQAIGELVDGLPARVWQFNRSEQTSSRHAVALAVHGADDLFLSPRLRLSLGLRLESVAGSATGAAQGIAWHTLLPRARLWWRTRPGSSTVAFVGYSRSAYRLTLDMLAVGDPAAPSADLYRWLPSRPLTAPGGPLVARVGPGTNGRTAFSAIDAELERPVSDELSFGLEMSPSVGRRFQIALVGRRESALVGLVNGGAPVASYTTFTVNDPGANTGKADDDKVITVFDRMPATFGADRYLLTNPVQDGALSGGLELSGEWAVSRFRIIGGATASIAVGPAASRGYGPLENDQALPGEAFVSPNGSTLARGRLFADRAFTVKLAGVYRFPSDITLGVIARYQDGQNFSRVLVFPSLSQGTEAVRAFAAGDSRFKFIGTLDARLQKGVTAGGRRFVVLLDAYNLLGLSYDVEERAAAQPNDRRGIAVQPPRTVHVGLQARF
jgi:hypothetical protein